MGLFKNKSSSNEHANGANGAMESSACTSKVAVSELRWHITCQRVINKAHYCKKYYRTSSSTYLRSRAVGACRLLRRNAISYS
jgi:hypothetical protein